MSELQARPPSPTENDDYTLRSSIHPSPFDLGVTYEGAIIEGSLRISPAKDIQRIHVDNPEDQEVLELARYAKTGRGGLIWTFRVRTDKPIKFLAFVGFWTDLGKTSTHFSLEVKAGKPPGGRLLFCDSPFDASSHWTHTNLGMLTEELQIQTNATDRLPDDLSPFHTVVLHSQGLRFLVEDKRRNIDQYLAQGGRVIVLANYFYRDTVMLANHLTESHGIRLEDRECGELLGDLRCTRQHIEDHPATQGVRQLRWYRPSPMLVRDGASILVHNPDNPNEGFLTCGGPHRNLFVVGLSLIHSLVCEGWPYDNGQLFANLLRGT